MSKYFKKISFHPRLAAGLDLFFGLVAVLLLLTVIKTWLLALAWILARVLWWVLLSKITYYPSNFSRVWHTTSLTMFQTGAFLLFAFAEWSYSRAALLGLLSIAPAVSFVLIPPAESDLSFARKPWRRWLLFLTVIGVGGLWGGVGAVNIFKISYWPALFWQFLAAAVGAVLGALWWREYGAIVQPRFWRFTAMSFIFSLELGWVLALTPVGYFVYFLLMTWQWYAVWLVGRFYLSAEGIIWKKQLGFLTINAAILAAVIFFLIRWQ